MQITNYELFAVPPRWLFLKLETSNGLVGWGEPIVQGRLQTVRTAVEELLEGYLIGGDPLRIEHHWDTLFRGGYYRGGPVLMSALAGIDQALWDIKGRHYGCPVHELLGGHVRNRLTVYHWLGSREFSNVSESLQNLRDEGYRAFKANAVGEFSPVATPNAVQTVENRISTLREAAGDDVHVGVDFHGRVSKPMAGVLLERLEPYGLMFVDQPLLPEHSDALPELAQRTSIPLATGERLYSRYDFKPLLTDGSVSIIQPDVTHVGGITELKKVAAMAEAFDVAVIPHCPLSPIAFAASLQVGFCTKNVVMQEQDLSLHDPESSVGLQYLENPNTFSFVDGFVERPTGPGLGIDVDETYVREQAKKEVNWHNPVWHHDDGSVAEW